MRYADLHVHTNLSDSTFSPQEAAACAREKGLDGIALVDHDCVDGIGPCIDFVKSSGFTLEIIPGIEMTAEKEEAEIHILGYFIDWTAPWLSDRLRNIQESRVARVHTMIEKLGKLGVCIKAEDVFRISGSGSVGRLHLALALKQAKKIKTLDEAFSKYIGFMKPCYVRHTHLTPREAVGLIRRAGGVAVVAHPAIQKRDDLLPELVEDGIRGIEVYHTDHNASAVARYAKFAEERGLIATGGSDCHGMGKGRVLMGGIKVPYTVVDALREEANRISRGKGI